MAKKCLSNYRKINLFHVLRPTLQTIPLFCATWVREYTATRAQGCTWHKRVPYSCACAAQVSIGLSLAKQTLLYCIKKLQIQEVKEDIKHVFVAALVKGIFFKQILKEMLRNFQENSLREVEAASLHRLWVGWLSVIC